MAVDTDQNTKHLYGFGPFRVDAEKELLLRGDETVPIAPKTFQILLVLIRSKKEVVTKDELMKAVWPDTFVEEVNLSRNIFLLRKALGETPKDHQYIVTVPGRGYRFTEEVQFLPEQQEVNIVAVSHDKVQVEVMEIGRGRWLAIAAVALVALAAGAVRLFVHRKPVLTEKDTVVLADFTNTTGDAIFDDTLRQGLGIQLEQSPFFYLVTDVRIRQVLRMMGQPTDARLAPEIAREICERTASAAVLNGSIALLGSQYVLGLRAVDCRNGRVLDEEQVQAARKEDVLNALSQIARRFRTRVGESLATVEKYGTTLIDATTPSLEALKAYSLGRKSRATVGDIAARPFFRRAVELDPNFAMAYAQMSTTYGNNREAELAAENIRKAYELRAKVSEPERFYIEAHYYEYGTGEWEKAVPVFEQWQQTYPDYYGPYNTLAAIFRILGNPQKSLEQIREAMRLEPNFALNYYNLAVDCTFLNRLDEAEEVFRQAEERKLESDGMPTARYLLAFVKGDTARMEQVASAAMGRPGKEDSILGAQADTEAWYGRLKNARELKRRAMDSALHNSGKESAGLNEINGALLQGAAGNLKLARADADAALKLAPNRNVREGAAVVMAWAGDRVAAEKLSAGLDKDFPLDTLVQRYWLPMIRAAIALERKDPGKAVELLQVANAIELGDSRLIAVYLRGEAYLMLHDGSRAAGEFQKFIDHRTLVANSEWAALARLGLARAYAMQGDSAKTRFEYQDFLTLWKDADQDLPLLINAKREYAALR
jgi:DNA-binding winged helix-turn-helix (wHTH) protein/tetratricopeptide (TPR) repeat protein